MMDLLRYATQERFITFMETKIITGKNNDVNAN